MLAFLDGQSIGSMMDIFGGITAILYVLPKSVQRIDISKLGLLEIEHKQRSMNYQVNRRISDIDLVPSVTNSDRWSPLAMTLAATPAGFTALETISKRRPVGGER